MPSDKAEGATNNRVQLRDNKRPWQDSRYPVDGRGRGIKMAGAHNNRLSRVTSSSWQAWDFPGFTGGKPTSWELPESEQTGKVISVGRHGFGHALLPLTSGPWFLASLTILSYQIAFQEKYLFCLSWQELFFPDCNKEC